MGNFIKCLAKIHNDQVYLGSVAAWRGPGRVKGAEFHMNNFSGNHVVEDGECYLVRGVSSCYLLKYAPYTLR